MFRTRFVAAPVFVLVGLFAANSWAQTSSPLIFDADFEDGTRGPFAPQGSPERKMPEIESQIVRSGKFGTRSFLDSSAPERHYRERVEMKVKGSANATEIGKAYWYGWSVYLASPWPIDQTSGEILSQFHKTVDENEPNPNPTLKFGTRPKSDHWVISSLSDPREFSSDKAGVTSKNFDGGKIAIDEWTDWVVNVKWSYKDDGFLKIWKNGELIVDATGPNCSNDTLGPHFKMGVYKPSWKDHAPSPDVKTRLAYHDEFRMAGADASYEDVAPPGPREGTGRRPVPPVLAIR